MKRPGLTGWILAGMAAGVALGILAPAWGRQLAPVGTMFLRLIRSIVAPLVFATLVAGIAGAGNVKRMGRIGGKALVYFEIATTLALFLGLAAAGLVRPGDGISLAGAGTEAGPVGHPAGFAALLEQAVPASLIDAMARNDVLQVVVFTFLFGAACAALGAKAGPVVNFCASLAEVMFRYTNYVMWLAPLGVGASIAATVGSKGPSILLGLGKFTATLYGSAMLCILLVLLPGLLLFRVPLAPFARAARGPFCLGFSTASSEAALPLALENMEQFGVPRHISGFVIPTGCSFNLVGSTLFLSLALVFVAQAAGRTLGAGEELMMMLTLMLTSKGVVGVPRASFVVLAAAVATFHLPAEGIAVLLGVDALLDMARSALNILGNCVAAVVVARWEGYKLPAASAATARFGSI